MKLFPKTTDLFNDVFDDVFTSPFFTNNAKVMKTDITENDDSYLLDIELPGCLKEDISLQLVDGYLQVQAKQHTSSEEKDEKGNIIRQERYRGSFERSFYVGNQVKEEDIKATYTNGELKITVPKQTSQVSEKKTIMID